MRRVKKFISFINVLVILTSWAPSSLGEAYSNPLIKPQEMMEYQKLPKMMVNILLLGIDFGHKGYWGSGIKRTLEDCHTDAMMVLAIDLDNHSLDLVSLPRDTLTYVPGVKGIYKLNAAVNCGDGTVEDGLRKAAEASSWLLGGVKIDYYFAIDMNAMIVAGDEIGGVDFNLEMTYTGNSGKKYRKGLQHLDGTGITDYLRARTNATINYNDIGRTNRQRELMAAIIAKLKVEKGFVLNTISLLQKIQGGFFTNITQNLNAESLMTDLLPLLSALMRVDMESAGSYVLTGKYRYALKNWNFTFTDQEHRVSVIRDVYGITVPKLEFVSYGYTKWLTANALPIVRYISVADQLRDSVTAQHGSLSIVQEEALAVFDQALEQLKASFQTASISMETVDTKTMKKAGTTLRKAGEDLVNLFDGMEKPDWTTGKAWYNDRMFNEKDVNFH